MTRLFFHAARRRCSQYLRTYKAQKGLKKKSLRTAPQERQLFLPHRVCNYVSKTNRHVWTIGPSVTPTSPDQPMTSRKRLIGRIGVCCGAGELGSISGPERQHLLSEDQSPAASHPSASLPSTKCCCVRVFLGGEEVIHDSSAGLCWLCWTWSWRAIASARMFCHLAVPQVSLN